MAIRFCGGVTPPTQQDINKGVPTSGSNNNNEPSVVVPNQQVEHAQRQGLQVRKSCGEKELIPTHIVVQIEALQREVKSPFSPEVVLGKEASYEVQNSHNPLKTSLGKDVIFQIRETPYNFTPNHRTFTAISDHINQETFNTNEAPVVEGEGGQASASASKEVVGDSNEPNPFGLRASRVAANVPVSEITKLSNRQPNSSSTF
ncbi:hypothetical protein HID58_078472 [Brassica napus]|uniref:Uncharacterized protein n=1 Tax=Brassica napus TaxID=3708 RepID=A0ABQ7YU45_BRANA|nr:hypothetical protein HID58_078472 [Brassica napus]